MKRTVENPVFDFNRGSSVNEQINLNFNKTLINIKKQISDAPGN